MADDFTELLRSIWAERSWIFQGIGVAALAGLWTVVRWLTRRRRPKSRAQTTVSADNPKQVPPPVQTVARRAPHMAPAPAAQSPGLLKVQNPDAAVPAPWYRRLDDPVAVIADSIMAELRLADGSDVYVHPTNDARGSRLEVEDAIARLKRHEMIDTYYSPGVHTAVQLSLTPKGRSFLV